MNTSLVAVDCHAYDFPLGNPLNLLFACVHKGPLVIECTNIKQRCVPFFFHNARKAKP